jgi:hypothetical protein
LVDGESWFKVKPGKKVSETLFQRTSKVWWLWPVMWAMWEE